jgi:hypothetical protein
MGGSSTQVVGSGGASVAAAGGSVATGGASASGGSTGTGGNSTGASGASGKVNSGGGGTGGNVMAVGDGGIGVAAKCETPVGPGLPAGAPALTKGTWKDISPPMVTFGNNVFTQGMAVDPCNPAILYLTVSAFDASKGGLFKSLDAGGTWKRVGKVTTGIGYLDEPIRVRIDPKNTQHLYVGDGVRGSTEGFWVSTDGGETFTKPKGFVDIQSGPDKIFADDVYDVSVDPTDFNHVLVSFHFAWGWTDSKWNAAAGVLESKDGGGTWIIHAPDGWGGYGHSIHFLYKPELGIGSPDTWMLSTQDGTRHRTTDAGKTWTHSKDGGIVHGGGTIYYTKAGVLYASGNPQNLRSTDNGATWKVLSGPSSTAIFGDGTTLYTGKVFGPAPVVTSPESDGLTWKDYNSQQFTQGPFEFGYDVINGVVYNASWTAGLWALKP